MTRKSSKTTRVPRGKQTGKPVRPGQEEQATTAEFEREGMGVAAKE